jgi:hypothetical protein
MSEDAPTIEPGQRWQGRAHPRVIIETGAKLTSISQHHVVQIQDAAGRECCVTDIIWAHELLRDYQLLPPDGHATDLERLAARVAALGLWPATAVTIEPADPIAKDDLAVLAVVGRMYLDALDDDPENEMLTLPEAIGVTAVRDAVERHERGGRRP